LNPPLWHRTRDGNAELRSARHALNARQRQLLILIDGRRGPSELARLFAASDLASGLALLIRLGLIAQADGDAPVTASAAPVTLPTGPSTLPPFDTLPAAVATVPADPQTALTRTRMIAALRELTGEHGDPLAARLERCTALRELRELLPATLSIVEAVGGYPATHAFLDRAGRI
jgi:hypothetical protein